MSFHLHRSLSLPGGPVVRLSYLLWHLTALRRARRIVSDEHIDVVHHVSWGSATSPTLAAGLACPFVWGPLGGGQSVPPAFRWSLGAPAALRETIRALRLRSAHRNPLLRRTARRAAVVLATNRETEDLVKRMGARCVRRAPDTAVEQTWLVPGEHVEGSEALRVAWIGRLEPHKAPFLALDAFARVACEREATLVVAGDGSLASACRERAEKLGIADRVEFAGHVSRAQVRDELSKCHLLLFTSLRDSYPPAVLEAMAVGLPIVALGHQSLVDLPEGVSLRVPVVSAEQVIRDAGQAIVRLIDCPETRRTMSDAARHYVTTEHLWPNRIDFIEKVYRECLA